MKVIRWSFFLPREKYQMVDKRACWHHLTPNDNHLFCDNMSTLHVTITFSICKRMITIFFSLKNVPFFGSSCFKHEGEDIRFSD